MVLDSVLAFLSRRAALPAVLIGGAFTSAAWFGVFELTLSASKLLMPVPEHQDSRAQVSGVLVVPASSGAVLWAGWRAAPGLAPTPDKLTDLRGWLGVARSMPIKHVASVGAASAAVGAVACRAVQYKGGA